MEYQSLTSDQSSAQSLRQEVGQFLASKDIPPGCYQENTLYFLANKESGSENDSQTDSR